MDFVEIKIKKFKSLIKRSDIKNPQWFAMEHDVLEHPDFFEITGDEFKAYVWIVGIATKLNNSEIRVYPGLCARRLNISEKVVHATIEKLKGKRFDVTDPLRIRTDSVRTRYATEQDKTEQDKTEQDTTGNKNTSYSLGASNFSQPQSLQEFKNLFSENQKVWQKRFDNNQVWIDAELEKAYEYFFINETKPKSKSLRGWKQRITGWLNRGWEKHAKKAQPNNQTQTATSGANDAEAFVDQAIQAFESNSGIAYYGLERAAFQLAKKIGIDPYGIKNGSIQAKFERRKWIENYKRNINQKVMGE